MKKLLVATTTIFALLFSLTPMSATAAPVAIFQGGTGTSTLPSLGKVLVGNASGGYDYAATSTFGASGSSASGGTGAIQYANGTSFAGNNTVFFWDPTTKEMGIGNAVPDAPLTISTSTSFSGVPYGTLFHGVLEGGANARVIVSTYNGTTANGTIFQGRRARGTAASPSSPSADDTLVVLGGDGYGVTGFHSTSLGGFVMKAESAPFSDTSAATYLSFWTSATTTATGVEKARITSTGKWGIGTTSPWGTESVVGNSGTSPISVVASSTGIDVFRVNADGSVSNRFSSGTSTKVMQLSDPDSFPSITAANTLATYSDDPSRLIQCGTAAAASCFIRNHGFAAASQLYQGTNAQTITLTTLYNNVVVGRGALTYGGYHYVMYASTTGFLITSPIRRATSSPVINNSASSAWSTSTISGVDTSTTGFLVGAANGNLYIATSTTAIGVYSISTSTNTLTYTGTITITGANILLTNTRVNDNGMYIGFAAAPFTRKYTLAGVAVADADNIGVAAPSTTGPDMFATKYSLYGLYGNSTTLLSKMYGY